MSSQGNTSRSPFTLMPDSHKAYDREDLASQVGNSDDEMDDLSDSPSSYTSGSRPTTPHAVRLSLSKPKSAPPSTTHLPYTIAHKAERILGLSPGTLPHALAALESAKEEVRRLELPIAPLLPFPSEPVSRDTAHSNGMRGRIDRAVRAMSIALPSGTRIPGVVVGVGGKEDEARRERVRRANDGVLYWQREVARLSEPQKTVRR
ncbi:hypothetical protein DB88DRAFT_516565 [Papiliotrema laurentii]|uniref:Uncharacterized protein n=1 Tax=Papiliotrema laurentii TaxID=5418 RepID=A0AAD9FX69_PAPLA|nr:hypothetical protein DB88DRAFT_516565 [Papiliotrema laurentii]